MRSLQRHRSIRHLTMAFLLACAVCVLVAPALSAQGKGLVLIERKAPDDRARLTRKGVPLVAELNSVLLAYGDLERVRVKAQKLGYEIRILDDAAEGFTYGTAGLRPGWTEQDLAACGTVLWAGENLALVKSMPEQDLACRRSQYLLYHGLRLEPLKPQIAPGQDRQTPSAANTEAAAWMPLVQEMVDAMTAPGVIGHWEDVINSAATRYSPDPGCSQAADMVFAKFEAANLESAFQYHVAGHAPNIIGTVTGKIHPERVYIMVGHLDDMPDSGPAPGANDNASGAAAVTALAEIMSRYSFEKTVKFLAVTGEEFGFYGSSAYASDAYGRNEEIAGVLNADMIGWEGDGSPNPETLDLIYNNTSQWLGELFAQLAADYRTGCDVDAFLCPSFNRSDHVPFWNSGWSATFAMTDAEGYCNHPGNYPGYHTPNDTQANCADPSFYASAVRAHLATLAHLAVPLCRNPQPAASMMATPIGDNTVLVSWAPAGDKVTYEIYRSPGGCSSSYPYILIGQTAATAFVDTTASGTLTHGYYVRVKDKLGYCLSPPSDCVEASPAGECLEAPVFDGISAVSDDQDNACALRLVWPDVTADVCGEGATFNIYRSTDDDFSPGPASLLASCLAGNTYTDRSVEPFTQYTYTVRAESKGVGQAGPCGGTEDNNTARASGMPTGVPTVYFSEDFESAPDQWNAGGTWQLSTDQALSGANSMFGGNESLSCANLRLKNALLLPAGKQIALAFYAFYDLEFSYDGVQVQISTDGGANWALLSPERGYTGSSNVNCGRRIGNALFTGSAAAWTLWRADLTPYSGQSILMRFIMMSDTWVNSGGFYLDDVRIYSTGSCGLKVAGQSPGRTDTCVFGGAGNGDGTLDAGEEVTLELTAANLGALPVSNVDAILSSTTPGVTITGETTSFPDLDGESSALRTGPALSFRLAPSVSCGAAVDLDVTFTTDQGSWSQAYGWRAGRILPSGGNALEEDFDTEGIPPTWTIMDGFADGNSWSTDDSSDPAGCESLDPGPPFAGTWAIVNSDCAGPVDMDEALLSPVMDLSAAGAVILEFDHYLERFLTETATLEVRSSRTGGSWAIVKQWEADTSNPEHEAVDLTALAAAAADVQIRWHYQDANYDLFWAIDNVVLSFTSAGGCRMNPCVGLPDEVSRSGSDHPLLVIKDDGTLCPSGVCLYFSKDPIAEGYNIYEGTIGGWFSHDSTSGNLCDAVSTDLGTGHMRTMLTPSAGDHYYLVTAFNAAGEGTAGDGPKDAQCSCPP